MKLRNKLFLTYAGVGFVVGIIGIIMTSIVYSNNLKNKVQSNLYSTVEDQSEAIDSFFEEKKKDIYVLVENPVIKKLFTENLYSDYSELKVEIKKKADSVVGEIEEYLKENSDKTVLDLQKDEVFRKLAVQKVGVSGYTAITDYDSLVCRLHTNPKMENLNLETLSESLPGFWWTMSRTKGGAVSSGFYDWTEADGTITQKYMHISIVKEKTKDGVGLSVAATTYVNEYGQNLQVLKETSDYVKNFNDTYGYSDILLISKDADILWTANRGKDFGTSLTDGPYSNSKLAKIFKDTLEQEKTLISDYDHYIDGNLYLFISSPVLEGENLLGVVVTKLSKNQIDRLLNNGSESPDGILSYLVDPDKNLRSNLNDEGGATLERTIDNANTQHCANDLKIYSLDSNIERHEEPLFTYKGIMGQKVYGLPSVISSIGWCLISELDVNSVTSPIRDVLLINAALWSGIVILFFFLSYMLSKNISKSLEDLRNSAMEITQSGLGNQPVVSSEGEIADLAKAFKMMASEIKGHQQKLENQVKERTLELQNTKTELEKRQAALLNILEDEKKLEDKLKEDKETSNLIVGSMGEGLLMINSDYEIELINLKAQALFDAEDKDVLGKKWMDVVKAYAGEKEIPFKERTSIKVLNTGTSYVTTLEDNHYYILPSGKKFPVTSVTTPIIKDGKVAGVVKVFKDASEEKERDIIINETIRAKTEELTEEQQRSYSILENASEGIVLTDRAGKVMYMNPAFTDITGYKEEVLKGKDFSEIFNAKDIKGEKISPADLSDAAAVTADKHETQVLIGDNEDEMATLKINSAPVKLGNEFIGVVRIFHDITEEALLQQQKDDFFSIASHELRTPLTVISGNIDTILSGYGKSKFSTQDEQLLNDSMLASDRLIKMVSDFLNISRLDQGRLKYELKAIDSCQVVGEAIREVKPLIDEKGLYLKYECDKNHKDVNVDEGLLKEIVINLVGNAVKFTDKGGITVKHEIKGEFMKYSITDTGMGIDKSKQGLLFRRFQQVMERTLTRQAGGTGLGLYISREFARVMGGDLILERSDKGKGTTFSFTIPITSEK